MAIAGTAGGPNWTDIATAIGTVGAVVVAVGIALWAEYRSDKRVKDERARSDRILAEQRKQDQAAIADERAHGRAQLEEERRLALEREQLAEAHAVQVVLGEKNAGKPDGHGWQDGSFKELAAMVVNHGSFTITSVDARFSYASGSNGLTAPVRSKRLTGFGDTRERLRDGWYPSAEHAMDGVLTPRDAGVRFESPVVPASALLAPLPVVRWTDQWDTRWEHKRGVVRHVRNDEPW